MSSLTLCQKGVLPVSDSFNYTFLTANFQFDLCVHGWHQTSFPISKYPRASKNGWLGFWWNSNSWMIDLLQSVIVNNILLITDSGGSAVLLLLDLTAAFDTVDHSNLILRLEQCDIKGNPLEWFRSYLSERTLMILRPPQLHLLVVSRRVPY